MKRTILMLAMLVLPGLGAAAEGPGATTELWAGHQLVRGERKIPVIGTLDTRTDTLVLARVERRGDEIVLHQQACRMTFAPVAGVKVAFRQGVEPHLPRATIRFRRDGERWVAAPWSTHWGEEDLDGDGRPGATLSVEATLCGGTLAVGATSHSRARGAEAEGGLRGDMQVQVDQKILDTSGACLSMMARDSSERVRGNFAYVPVPAGSTCESLLAGGWPAHASEAR